MKFIKKHRFKIVILLIILGTIYVIYSIKQQTFYQKNPGLIPPRHNYDIQVELSTGDRAQYEADVKKYDDLIKNFVPGTGEQEINFGNGIKGKGLVNQKPKEDWFIQKGIALEKLGRYTEAIETINKLFTIYDDSPEGWNNIAALYNTVGEYKRAIWNLEKIIEKYPSKKKAYIKEIIMLYAIVGETKKAWNMYFEYEEEYSIRSLDVINAIREAEGKDLLTEKQLEMLNR